jgi:hypothetical protein
MRLIMNARGVLLGGLVAILVAATVGCASGPGRAGAANENRVSQEELVQTNARNVYDALTTLRPSWLTTRGAVSINDPSEAEANVYMNGTRMGGLEYLRQVSIMDVSELRYWAAGEAGARFGMGNPRGVIEVIPRR